MYKNENKLISHIGESFPNRECSLFMGRRAGIWEGASEVLLPYVGGVRKVLLWGRGGGGKKSLMVCILRCSGF